MTQEAEKPIYRCFEIEKNLYSEERRTNRCSSRHWSLAAAEKHAKSEFFPYLSSNQPYEQERLEIRDESGKVHVSFVKSTTLGRSYYARWVKQENAS